MKKKELLELKAKETVELKKLLKEKSVELTKCKVDLKASREKNLKKVKNLRRSIAQVMTIIREKEIIEQSAKNKEHDGE